MNTVDTLESRTGKRWAVCSNRGNARTRKGLLFMIVLLLGSNPAQAQWLTQSFELRDGWNAIYLHVNSSYATLDDLIEGDPFNPIQEIWMWSPNPSAAQFITDPQSPSQPSYWLNWSRNPSPSANLTSLPGNVACLVRSSGNYTWNLKGKPVAPDYQWTSSGLNFFGFPTLPDTAPSFDSFLDGAPEMKVGAEIFAYRGGAIADNPVQIFDLTSRNVNRGEAFWIRSATGSRYTGPFEVVASGPSGIQFGDSLGQATFRIRNNAPQEITVTLTGVASEAPPVGQSAIHGQVPVLVRGELDTTLLTFTHVPLAAGPRQWVLKRKGQVGSEVEVIIGVDRQHMTAVAGGSYASVLRFTDSLNHSRIDVPVAAEVASPVGLWIGRASVTSVDHSLNNYATAENDTELAELLNRLGLVEGVDGHFEIDAPTKRVLVFGGPEEKTGEYLLDGAGRTDAGTVARPFPLRLIVHHDGTTKRLLQRVYHGVGTSSNTVVATQQSHLLSSHLASARRISAVHLPATPGNLPWNLSGEMRPGANLATTVRVSYNDQAANPYLHTYHPDHDNLDASFETAQPIGSESYEIERVITLSFKAPPDDFASLTRGSSTLSGDYTEEVIFRGKNNAQRSYRVRGAFALNQIADTATFIQ